MELDGMKVYGKEDIINMMDFESDMDKEITSDIISLLTVECAKGIRDNKIVQIPYIGNIRKDAFYKEFQTHKPFLHDIRQERTKEQYKEYIKELQDSIRKKVRTEDQLNVEIRKCRLKNKVDYEKLYKMCGKAYAEMWIFAKCCFRIIPFDEDVEFALQQIWKEENET